jgi:hypothetical protein
MPEYRNYSTFLKSVKFKTGDKVSFKTYNSIGIGGTGNKYGFVEEDFFINLSDQRVIKLTLDPPDGGLSSIYIQQGKCRKAE